MPKIDVFYYPKDRAAKYREVKEISYPTIETVEMKDRFYTAVSMSNLGKTQDDEVKNFHKKVKASIASAGFELYDPGTYKPEKNPTHKEIGVRDLNKVCEAQFLSFTNMFPSTGSGIEEAIAVSLLKPVFVITEPNHYVSRLSTGLPGVVALSVNSDSFDRLTEFLGKLKKFEFGMGECSDHKYVPLGFSTGGLGKVSCLQCLAEELDVGYKFVSKEGDPYLKK